MLGRTQKVYTDIVNPYDGYQLIFPEEWIGRVTAVYDEQKRMLSIRQVTDGQIGDELFAVVAFPVKETNPFGEEFMFLKLTDTTRYELRYNKAVDETLTANMIHEMFSLCEIE